MASQQIYIFTPGTRWAFARPNYLGIQEDSEATGEGYVGDKGHKHTQNQALLVLLFMEQLGTRSAIPLTSKIEEGRLWMAWHPCPWDILSMPSKWQMPVWDMPAKSGEKETLTFPVFLQPHKHWAINCKEKLYSLADFFFSSSPIVLWI